MPDRFSIARCCCAGETFPHFMVQLGQQRPIFFSTSGVDIVYTDGPNDYQTQDPNINYVTRYYRSTEDSIGVAQHYENGVYVGNNGGGVPNVFRQVAGEDYIDFMGCQFLSPPFGTFDMNLISDGLAGGFFTATRTNQRFTVGLPDLAVHRGFDLGESLFTLPAREFDMQNFYTNTFSDRIVTGGAISGVENGEYLYDIQLSASNHGGLTEWFGHEPFRIIGHIATHNSLASGTEETYSFEVAGAPAGTPKQPTCLDQTVDVTDRRVTPGGIFVEGYGFRWSLIPIDFGGINPRYLPRGPGVGASQATRLFGDPEPDIGDKLKIELKLSGDQIQPVFSINDTVYNLRAPGNVEFEPPSRTFFATQNAPFFYGVSAGQPTEIGYTPNLPFGSASAISYFSSLTATTTWGGIRYANYHKDYWNHPDAFMNPQNFLPNGTWRFTIGEDVKIYLQSRGYEPPLNINWNPGDFPPGFDIDEYGTITGRPLNPQVGFATITVNGVQDTYFWTAG